MKKLYFCKIILLILSLLLMFNTGLASASEPKFGGTLNIGISGDPSSLNPLVGNDLEGGWILDLIYPYLMVMDEDGNKIPYIIEEPVFSVDGMTITVTLKDGLVWEDGIKLTSEDLAFTYKVVRELNLQYRSVLDGVTWETPNDKTIVFHLSRIFPAFIDNIGFWQRIVPAHIWSKIDDIKNFTNDTPVGLGPFKLTDYKRGQYYILESVDRWFLSPEGKPYLDKVIFKPYPDINTMVLALKSGDVDLTAKEIPPAAAKELKGNDAFNVVQNMSLGYEHMVFNLRNELLKDVNLRKAMAMAVDRNKVVYLAFDGDAVEMTGMISPIYKKFQIGNNFPSYDVEGAKKLLADSGYKDTDNDGILNATNGDNLSFKVMFANTYSEHEKISKILISNMAAIGVQLIPVPMEKSLQMDKLYNTHEWELSIGTWGIIDVDDVSSVEVLFNSTSILNWMAWNNKNADEAMQPVLTEEEIMKNMNIFQKEIIKDIPDLPMVVRKLNFAYSKKFQGFRLFPSNLKGLVDPQSLGQVYKVK